MARAAARRSLAAFRISIALGSSTGWTVGAAAFFDALAGLAACGVGCDCWAYPLVVRNTPSVSSSAHLKNLSRIIIPPDEHTLPLPFDGEGEKTPSCLASQTPGLRHHTEAAGIRVAHPYPPQSRSLDSGRPVPHYH